MRRRCCQGVTERCNFYCCHLICQGRDKPSVRLIKGQPGIHYPPVMWRHFFFFFASSVVEVMTEGGKRWKIIRQVELLVYYGNPVTAASLCGDV